MHIFELRKYLELILPTELLLVPAFLWLLDGADHAWLARQSAVLLRHQRQAEATGLERAIFRIRTYRHPILQADLDYIA
jgi:hypothetical protein